MLERSEAYAAVMVDDLTTTGLEEPYRLFTSRAEYRLLLGVDTVLPRLLPHGRRLGLIGRGGVREGDASGEERIRRAEPALRAAGLNPSTENGRCSARSSGSVWRARYQLYKLLQRQDLDINSARAGWSPEVFEGLTPEERELPREPRPLRGLHPAREGAARAA